MKREILIGMIKWTMRYYGSDAGERAQPGSKLRAQAEHIADLIEQYNEAQIYTSGLDEIKIGFVYDFEKEAGI